jgi:hypothetical protein
MIRFELRASGLTRGDHGPKWPGCSGRAAVGKDGIMFNGARDVELTDLAELLADLLGCPVLNKTLRGALSKSDPQEKPNLSLSI